MIIYLVPKGTGSLNQYLSRETGCDAIHIMRGTGWEAHEILLTISSHSAWATGLGMMAVLAALTLNVQGLSSLVKTKAIVKWPYINDTDVTLLEEIHPIRSQVFWRKHPSDDCSVYHPYPFGLCQLPTPWSKLGWDSPSTAGPKCRGLCLAWSSKILFFHCGSSEASLAPHSRAY